MASKRTRVGAGTHERVLFGAVAMFGALPLVLLAALAGADGLTGATGLFPGDQLQYLAWITSLAEHGLAASNFDLGSHPHVFIGPVFFVSSLLVRAGASPQLAYLLWLPLAAGALVVAYRSFVASSLADRFDRACALCLALFAFTPLLPIGDWVGLVGGEVRRDFGLVATDTSPALALWGYFPVALALALCGGVLAPFEISMAVPAFTDRPTWIGHPVWTPEFSFRIPQAERLFAGRSSDAGAVRFVRYLKPRVVLASCGTSPSLSRQLEPLVERSRRFGCAAVYVLAP